MPIETPGYSAQAALTAYMSLPEYMEAGFVYVHAGCRGRDAGAPAGVTDIKAAVRYLRYTDNTIPGDAEKIFVFGMSGGGAQSAIVGAAGDSELYAPYLEQIGAVQGVSDAVYGSMDWCPITNLDSADEAYEWMMGVTRNGLSDDEQAISDALAASFADYINQAGIKDETGNVLTLEESADGIYQAGSYYDYIVGVVENSLNSFLSDTEFPYDSSSGGNEGGPGGRGAFDQLDAGQGENELFGYGDGNGTHFDALLADILKELESSFASDFEEDLQKTDMAGYTVAQRLNMYTPLYYLLESQDGYRASTPAKHWRIRTGIAQSDTSLTTEVNLALALQNYDGVESVDFATVWGQKHVKAERTGDSSTNFIAWVKECMK